MNFLKSIFGAVGQFVLQTAGIFVFFAFIELGISCATVFGLTSQQLVELNGIMSYGILLSIPIVFQVLWLGSALIGCLAGIVVEIPIAAVSKSVDWSINTITIDRTEAFFANITVLAALHGVPLLVYFLRDLGMDGILSFDSCLNVLDSLLMTTLLGSVVGVLSTAMVVALVDTAKH